MSFQITTATKRVAALKSRIRAVQGGTSASKTISILIYLIARAQSDKTPTITSVVSESFPHLKRGAIRDFLNILQTQKYFKDDLWNATDFTYTFETGSKIEFFSADQPGKVRGPRRDRLFINEANNLPLETFEQLEVRTKEFIFLDWNPSNEFWFYSDVLNKRNDIDHIVLTYKDNEALDTNIVNAIEARKNRPGWWKVYGEGLLGEVEGRIYKDWQVIDTIPHEARYIRTGVDFGYTNDPTAIVDVYYYNGGYILDEIAFNTGLNNNQIADILKETELNRIVVADSAEPKSIDEIKLRGVNILPANKGNDSVRQGIDAVQSQRVSVTKRSVNIIKEYRNYLWATDKDGKLISPNEPEHIYSHCFAPETLVQTLNGRKRIEELVGTQGLLWTVDGLLARYSDVKPTRNDADVLSITFNDGDTITVTPDHLLLQPNDVWVEAGLLRPLDMIQSSTYGADLYLQWSEILQIRWREVLEGIRGKSTMVLAPLCLAHRKRTNSKAFSCPPQGREPRQQHYRQFGTETQNSPSQRPYDAREARAATPMGRQNTTPSQQVAWVKRGQGISQVTWQEKLGEPKTIFQRLLSLQASFLNLPRKLLWSKLPQKSATKTIARIERGRRALTYNLEVEGTHCLLANGVIAHNSMDAIRYALESVTRTVGDMDVDKGTEEHFMRNMSRFHSHSTR